MPTIFTAVEGGIVIQNTDADARTGRWCAPPEVPDRCYKCIDSETLAHYPAEAYIEEEVGGETIRYGVCHRCRQAYLKQEIIQRKEGEET